MYDIVDKTFFLLYVIMIIIRFLTVLYQVFELFFFNLD